MAVEALAGPPAKLRLHDPVLPLAVVGEREGVESGRDIECKLFAQTDLYAQVGRCGGPMCKVGLDANLLSVALG